MVEWETTWKRSFQKEKCNKIRGMVEWRESKMDIVVKIE